jgi:predicted metal-binding membrane protein
MAPVHAKMPTVRIASMPTPSRPTSLESAARHPQTILVLLFLVTLVPAWTWIVMMARDMYGSMLGPSAWMMATVWDAPRLALLWAMWAVMMAAMMLPSATPILLLYAGAVRHRGEGPHATVRVYALAAGYLLVWAVFSVGAVLLQRMLAARLLLTPMMEPASPLAGATLLLVAGVYQLTPLKRICLRSCRSPLAFLTRRWRSGRAGALRMGVEHGVHCLGCCWALMLLLFAGGVMNLTVILALTAWVLLEKLTPFGERGARVSGVLLIATSAWMLWP